MPEAPGLKTGGRGRRLPTADSSDDFPDYAPRAIGGIARTSFSRATSSRGGLRQLRERSRSSEGHSSRTTLPDALLMESPGAKQPPGDFRVEGGGVQVKVSKP